MLFVCAAVVLSACHGGHRAERAVSTTPTLTIPPTMTTLGYAANGHRIVLHVGEQRGIRLSRTPISEDGNWRPITTSRDEILAVKQTGGYPSRAPLTAIITASRPGTATLTAISDDWCLHSKTYACAPPQIAWQIAVIVTK
jgi:hypothetical protein